MSRSVHLIKRVTQRLDPVFVLRGLAHQPATGGRRTNTGLVHSTAPSSPKQAAGQNPRLLRLGGVQASRTLVSAASGKLPGEGDERVGRDMAPPFIYRSSHDGVTGEKALIKAAIEGNLARLKVIVKSLTEGNGDPSVIFSINTDGVNVLHVAASAGHLDVCKYLVEELGGNVNAPGYGAIALGAAPFMTAAQSGSCKVTEFILSKGVPVDIDCGRGTPLFFAATNEQDETLKILLDHHANPNIIVSDVGFPLLSAIVYRSLKCVKLLIKAGADVNSKGSMITPLVFVTMQGGYTNYVKLLLQDGADPNTPDDLGRLPIELAAVRDCKEEVEMLLPVTTQIPNAPDWSIEGVISYAKIEDKKPIEQRHLERRNAWFESHADTAFKQKEYKLASKCYDLAIAHGESATLYANRSLCRLMMGDGEGALSDALKCKMLRPNWAKACFRQAAARMLLKEYKQACDALEDAQKLEPGNAEIESELRKARELMKNPPGDCEQ